jgi:peptidoglycan-N-acetylglucosamine deacetylase
MDNSSDDGGDPEPASLFRNALIIVFLLFSCTKPSKTALSTAADTSIAVQPVKKEVVVQKKSPPKKKKKKVYLTFDDGPNKGTRNVLHITQDENVPVTFFIVGEHVFASSSQAETWDSLKIAKHIEICNHSFSHAHNRYDKYYQDADSVVRDFQKTGDTLQLDNDIVRTPGRNIWRIDSLRFTDIRKSAAAADSLEKAGFTVMGWDLEWHYDHKTMSVTATAERLMEQIDSVFRYKKTRQPDHLVLLAHDQVYVRSEDSCQLRVFLQLLKQRQEEFDFELVTSYPRLLPRS